MVSRSSMLHSLPVSLDFGMDLGNMGTLCRLLFVEQLGESRVDFIALRDRRHIELIAVDAAVCRPQAARFARGLADFGVDKVARKRQKLREQIGGRCA